jgi:hypothetical protein
MIPTYPLAWPAGWPRMPGGARKDGKFGTKAKQHGQHWLSTRDITLSEAADRVLLELERMGVPRRDVVVSTNVIPRLDGLPRSGQRAPADPGAAVYWNDRLARPRVMAIDQYTTVADNLAAIAATLDAMRAIERHGGAQILDRAFTGFTALPAPTMADVKHAYRRLASACHPDTGGSDAAMSELNVARGAAEKFVGETKS